MSPTGGDLGGSFSGPLDPCALSRLERLGGATLVGQMISLFLENAPQRVDSIRGGLDTGDVELVERSAHSLKSSAGNIGATRLLSLAEDIERAAEMKRTEGLPALVQDLLRELEVVRSRLESIVRTRGE